MPGPPAQTSGSGQHSAFSAQVVHANSTLNAFVGGKQKPWMANAAPVQPSPRPQPHPPRPQTQQNQQQQPSVLPKTPANVNVLPSPAPSDEPSPALSNPLDSPNPRTRPVTTTTQRQTTGQPQAVQSSLSPGVPWHSRPASSTAATAGSGAVERAAALEHATTQAPSESVRFSPAMAPPDLPQPNQTDQVANSTNGSPMAESQRLAAQSPSAPGQERPNKRRRVEPAASSLQAGAASLTFADLANFIDNRIDQQGGDQTLQPTVEKARFHILRDAPQTVSGLLFSDAETTSMGFEILDTVLKKNSGFSRPNLECVATFLVCLANNWTALHESSFNRHRDGDLAFWMAILVQKWIAGFTKTNKSIYWTVNFEFSSLLMTPVSSNGVIPALFSDTNTSYQQPRSMSRTNFSGSNSWWLSSKKSISSDCTSFEFAVAAARVVADDGADTSHYEQSAHAAEYVQFAGDWTTRECPLSTRSTEFFSRSNACLADGAVNGEPARLLAGRAQPATYANPYMHHMASVHHAAAQQQWPRERSLLPGQQASTIQFTASPQFGHGAGPIPRPPMQQQVMANVPQVAMWSQYPATIVPRRGQMIERSDWPHSHQEKKSLIMSLHQAHARSPDRTRHADDEGERYYQAVSSFAIEPFRLVYFHELELTVPPLAHASLCKEKQLPTLNGRPSMSTVREYTNGSLRYRLRSCRLDTDKAVTASDWVTRETSWPDYIFPHFNQAKLVVRRGTHHGKDLPVELTDFVVPGTNKLKVATMRAGPTADKIVRRFYLAVEILETLSHSAVLEHVWATGVLDSAQTLEKIRKRIEAVPDEDGIAVIDRTGITASELSIDLTDPFSASIFSIPARGSACTHMECFDLETWLNTRPIKQAIKCGHQNVCTCPKRLEPSEPDKWKCPICFADARPRSLRIDRFLLGVRKELEERNKLDTKSILVAADGTWRPVIEPVDDDDAGSDGDGPVSRGPGANTRKQPTKSASVERAAVEIIEID
ncbi:hypothetical protein J7T55_013506 [Diaporthe amygdali]|uniref:uncharacterized protein n=1 Tax=Phomopsis amygdali TaxID=1214568 RepID=UPI0022FEDDAF|nr:uncharacterized protein J7T55_013506 [Diaporthe amygdali]KAJ0119269.1 hypothetical protein J7T55_013506 [Diaporthe amygdali]